MMQVKFKRLDERAIIPCYALEHDAGMDVFSLERVCIQPNTTEIIRTGIASEIEPGYVALVWDKSGISNKRHLKVMGGVIDAGYRGEWLVGLHNLGKEPQIFEAGDKIAQVIIQPYIHANTTELNELSESVRGEGAFGSTGR